MRIIGSHDADGRRRIHILIPKQRKSRLYGIGAMQKHDAHFPHTRVRGERAQSHHDAFNASKREEHWEQEI